MMMVEMVGLSPRMRGNPEYPAGRCHPRRSIPAYAGEPRPSGRRNAPPEVYPRVCGGTVRTQAGDVAPQGLSPRMRGNHYPAQNARTRARSIPAYAGEPSIVSPPTPTHRVYPRVCGGTTGQ